MLHPRSLVAETRPFRILLGAVVAFTAGLPMAATAHAAAPEENWSRFRGPNGTGVSQAAAVPATWNDQDYNWKLELPGLGHSSPVAWGDRIFVLSANEDTGARLVLCISASQGKVLWQQEFAADPHRKHKKNSFATSTPAADADHVYVAWANGSQLTMLALKHTGETAWEADLGPFKGGHGFGTSPIVYHDLVVLGNDQDGTSSLLALERTTGKIRWKTERASQRTTYSTPCVYSPPGSDPLLIFTDWNHGISAVDPNTGALVWEKAVFGENTERAIGSPVVAGDLVIGTCGFVTSTKHVVALKPQAGKPSADTPLEVTEVYHLERGAPHIPTVLVQGDLLFLWADNGIVSCCEVATGRTLWQKRIGGTYMASPVCVGNKLYNISEDGEVLVLAADREYQELGKVALGDECHATPAVVNGALLLRTHKYLFSLGGKQAK